MGGIASAIGGAIGGVADAVGSVAEAAVDVASGVIDAVASNPILMAGAIATPFALSAMATGAAAGTGISLAGASMGEGLAFAPTLGAGIGSAGITSAGLGAFGSGMGISSAALGAAAAGTALGGSTFGTASMLDPFNFSPISEATNFGTSILDATGSDLAIFNPTQTAASTVMGNSPSMAFDSNYLSSNMFTQAKEAAALVDSPGMSFSNAIAEATGGTITPMPSTSMFSTAWDSAKGIVQTAQNIGSQAEKFMNQIGQTIAPNADPMVQKAITNFGTNMVTSGGDVEQSLKGSMIGPVAGMAGKEITDLTSASLGDFGSKLAGKAATGATGAMLSGASPEQALMGAGIGATGSTVTNLTGSPLLGGAAKTALGSALTGGDVGSNLLTYGVNQGVNQLSDYLVDAAGLPTKGLAGKVTSSLVGSLEDKLKSSVLPNPVNLTQAAKAPTNVSPLKQTSLTQVLQSKPTSATNQSTVPTSGVLPAGTAPATKVDVNKLKPVDLSTLGIKTS